MDEKRLADIPQYLDEAAGFKMDCSCGRTHQIDTRRFVVEMDALDQVPAVIKELGLSGRGTVVCDKNTFDVAGGRVVKKLKKAGFAVSEIVVPDGASGRPHATAHAVADVKSVMAGAGFAVAVGSGTINDLTKLASFELAIPYVCVPTAASMNGYTSAIAAITDHGGLKCTVPCHQPVAVVADLQMIADGPVHLAQAGLGDLESKIVSEVDFELAHLITGSYYCPVPGLVAERAVDLAEASAPGIESMEYSTMRSLMEALLLSGCSMKMAGTSAPASGGEHLVSHYWDMTASREGRFEGWHGAQVGVATMVMTTIYQMIGELNSKELDWDALRARARRKMDWYAHVAAHFGPLTDAVYPEFQKKILSPQAGEERIDWFEQNFSKVRERAAGVRQNGDLFAVLFDALAPVNLAKLNLTEDHLRRALLRAREIRGRYTVLDIAYELGLLESKVDEIIYRSGVLFDDFDEESGY